MTHQLFLKQQKAHNNIMKNNEIPPKFNLKHSLTWHIKVCREKKAKFNYTFSV